MKSERYILKTTVEDLQLLLGEVGLRFQLLQAFRPVTHHGHLELVIGFICDRQKRQKGVLLSMHSSMFAGR